MYDAFSVEWKIHHTGPTERGDSPCIGGLVQVYGFTLTRDYSTNTKLGNEAGTLPVYFLVIDGMP